MLTQINEEIKRIISRNSNLTHYLESLLKDVPFTHRSYLYDGNKEFHNPYLTPQAALDAWDKKLSVLENGDNFERNVYQFELPQKEKYGPQGGHEPIGALMKEIVLPSFVRGMQAGKPLPVELTPELERACENVVAIFKRFGVGNLSPRAVERVIDDMRARDTLNSNSGFPDFAQRDLPKVRFAAIKACKNGVWKTYPAIALFRRYNGKTRLVWMFPMAVNLQEGRFFQPLMDAIMKSGLSSTFFCPWKGFEAVRQQITYAYNRGAAIGASDFTSTDAHFQLNATRIVFRVLRELFKPQYREELWESLSYMHTIPLLVGPDKMLTGAHGVSSGSNWTNFIETVYDMIISEYVTLTSKTAISKPISGLYAIGDDMAWLASTGFPTSEPTFQEYLENVGLAFGQVIKADKTTAESDRVKTLQRLFQRGYRRSDGMCKGVYPTIRALKSSIYPERYHHDWSSDMFCARQYMILENCVDHPLFKDFVEFIVRGNVHLIPFAHKDSKRLDAITRQARSIPGLNPTYNQEKRDSSLANFESIAVARELSR
jgi:hypothetical protein